MKHILTAALFLFPLLCPLAHADDIALVDSGLIYPIDLRHEGSGRILGSIRRSDCGRPTLAGASFSTLAEVFLADYCLGLDSQNWGITSWGRGSSIVGGGQQNRLQSVIVDIGAFGSHDRVGRIEVQPLRISIRDHLLRFSYEIKVTGLSPSIKWSTGIQEFSFDTTVGHPSFGDGNGLLYPNLVFMPQQPRETGALVFSPHRISLQRAVDGTPPDLRVAAFVPFILRITEESWQMAFSRIAWVYEHARGERHCGWLECTDPSRAEVRAVEAISDL